MFKRFFGARRAANRAITDALYEQIVAAARQPVFYADWNVPDTPLGRFEMLSLHMFLVLHRLRGEAGVAREVAQDLTDAFFADVEHSIRELGIGDLGVPKRMKKLARMFYGRAACLWRGARARRPRDALAAALPRNVRPRRGAWPQALRRSPTMCWRRIAALRASRGRIWPRGRSAFPVAGDRLNGEEAGHDARPSDRRARCRSTPMSRACRTRACRWSSRPMKRSARALAADHGLLSVESLARRAAGRAVEAQWRQGRGRVEADITQECVVTLEPLESHISREPFRRSTFPEDSKLGRLGFHGRGEVHSRRGGPGQPGNLLRRHHRRRRAGGGIFRAGDRPLSAQARRLARRRRQAGDRPRPIRDPCTRS